MGRERLLRDWREGRTERGEQRGGNRERENRERENRESGEGNCEEERKRSTGSMTPHPFVSSGEENRRREVQAEEESAESVKRGLEGLSRVLLVFLRTGY